MYRHSRLRIAFLEELRGAGSQPDSPAPGGAEQDEPCCPCALAVLIPAGITGSLPELLGWGLPVPSAGIDEGLEAAHVLI